MEVSTISTERLGNDSLQFPKSNHVRMSTCLFDSNDNNKSAETKMLSSSTSASNIANTHDDEQQLIADITQTLETMLVRLETDEYPVVTATTSQSLIYDSCTKVSLITPVRDEEVDKTTDIVMLRNLEITPPPDSLKATPSPNATKGPDETNTAKNRRSKRTVSEQSDESTTSGRSKRQRRQTELFQFQAQSASKKVNSNRKPSKPNKPQPERPQVKNEEQIFQDVIFYERGDHLAIRNESNTFYLCQLTEDVREQKPFVKVRWLDTNDAEKTFFLTSHYDKVPQKSIIMPVTLEKSKADKKGKQIFTINDQIRNSILDRLKRSLNMPAE